MTELLSVGEVAAQLGVAPATVRSWGRRYGIVSATRTEGGHRRYTSEDLNRLRAMQDMVSSGIAPSEAARRAVGGVTHVADPPGPPRRSRPGGPGGRVLAVPGGSPEARGLARAAGRLDAEAATGQLSEMLVRRGAVATWRDVIAPVLVAVGQHWRRTGTGVEIEHILSEATIEAIRAYCAFLPAPAPGRPTLLACAPSDEHTLPLHILRAALAEQRVGVRMLGPRVPMPALAAAARRIGAKNVFIWRQIPESPQRPDEYAGLGRLCAGATVVGGPGWAGAALPDGVRWATDFPEAVRALAT